MNQNFTLEIINGANFQLTFLFILWSLFHLYSEFDQRELTWKEALLFPSISFVIALTSEKFGTAITRGVVWLWRMGGGNVPFSHVQNALLIFGACFTCGGLLWLIAILTKRRFGPWPWRIAALWILLYIAVSWFLEYR